MKQLIEIIVSKYIFILINFYLDNKKGTNRDQSAGNKNVNQDRTGNKNKNNVGASNDNSSKGK